MVYKLIKTVHSKLNKITDTKLKQQLSCPQVCLNKLQFVFVKSTK